jgi:hypothetical protein
VSARRIKSGPELLLGTWRSDRRRTEAQWVWPKRLAATRRREFFSMFGHLAQRFTRKRCYVTYEGTTSSEPYRVVWHGLDVFPQVVVVYGNGRGEKAQHIFFDTPDSFYVQGGKCAEFFRREK